PPRSSGTASAKPSPTPERRTSRTTRPRPNPRRRADDRPVRRGREQLRPGHVPLLPGRRRVQPSRALRRMHGCRARRGVPARLRPHAQLPDPHGGELMSTDQTPALARATEALNYVFDEEPRTALADLDEPTRLLLAEGARAAVSAALHDPDDPDWLARALYEQDEREEVAI